MSAIAKSIQSKTAQLSSEITAPFTGSTKIYLQGSRDDLKVGMREVHCSNTPSSFGEVFWPLSWTPLRNSCQTSTWTRSYLNGRSTQ